MRIYKSIHLTLRRPWSFKLYSVINISGLVIAITLVLAIFPCLTIYFDNCELANYKVARKNSMDLLRYE